ncbi:MAG: UvrD-helicase domain-containing protein, partial [Kordiimonadaceae bacterium]|nr:UvrD-helicase domain-containing protein [Kordiimonadaceae bacterium]
VIIEKIKRLLKQGVPPEDILALTCNGPAAQEIRDRLKQQDLQAVEVRTFHSFGRMILKQFHDDLDDSDEPDRTGLDEGGSGSRPRSSLQLSLLAKEASELQRFVYSSLQHHLKGPTFRQLVIDFYTMHFADHVSPLDYESLEDYWAEIRHDTMKSLAGCWVRSYEECVISNFFYFHGVEHQYEKEYPHTKYKYKPDFYINTLDIWMEHFGVNQNEQAPAFMNPRRYSEGMEWKRSLHRENGTKLLETFSHQFLDGSLITFLGSYLKESGLQLTQGSKDESLLLEKVNEALKDERLTQLICRVLLLSKDAKKPYPHLLSAAATLKDSKRATLFLKIFRKVYDDYENHLQSTHSIDFTDMVNNATELVSGGRYSRVFSHILIDEFQDVSQSRLDLVKELLGRNQKCTVFAVGDDWQSINRFAGSDVGVIREMSERLGRYVQVREIKETFRHSLQVAQLASQFILKNPIQMPKTVNARSNRTAHIFTLRNTPGQHDALKRALNSIDDMDGEEKSVLVLSRARIESLGEEFGIRDQEYPSLKIKVSTIHRSKGLEADHVIIIAYPFRKKRGTFPSKMKEDSIVEMCLPPATGFPFEDERRVFYVALTRTRETLWIIAQSGEPSEFVTEIEQNDAVVQLDTDAIIPICPKCKIKPLMWNEKWSSYQCAGYNICNEVMPVRLKCQHCRKDSQLAWIEGEYSCLTCNTTTRTCPTCRKAPLSKKRRNKAGKFEYQCQDFRGCGAKVLHRGAFR